jgi:hypothetical protein
MAAPSITYWHRVEPYPRGDSLEAGLAAAVRDPLWFLTRQWQLGEFQGEDAASPAFTTITTSTSTLDGWRTGDGPLVSYDGSAPLESVIEAESTTPDLRTAVELGQALENRLGGAVDGVIAALRNAYPVPRPDELSLMDQRDPALVRLARVCGGRATHGINALRELRAAAPGLPARLQVPSGTETNVAAAAAWFIAWTEASLGPIGTEDAPAWRPDRLEYAFSASARTPDGVAVELTGHAGTHGEFDWYAFDETSRGAAATAASAPAATVSLLPTPVRFSGMPDPRWWAFEDSRVNWSGVDTDRRDLARLLVVDFMLVQGTDWFMVPCGHQVGSLIRVDQLLVRDVFGELTLVGRADAQAGTGRQRWTMFSTLTADGGLADYALLPPSALRTTLDGPDLEEVRFLRDEQANLVWAVEAITEDGTGRPLPGNQRAAAVPDPEPPAGTGGLHYRLQTTVPVNWIPFLPVQLDDTRRAVALERAAKQRDIDGVLTAVAPAGRVLRPDGLDVYRIPEEEVPRSGTRVLRAVRRTRWLDGSTQLWTARRRRAGQGGAASGLRYDVVDGP